MARRLLDGLRRSTPWFTVQPAPMIPLLSAVSLMCVHLLAARRPLSDLQNGPWLSFSGGAAAAYVFLHILPGLAGMSVALAHDDHPWPGGEWVFVGALAGACAFHAAEDYTARAEERGEATRDLRFWTHIGAFSLYNLLIGAMLVIYPERNLLDAALYQAALILHFAVLDQSFRRRHKGAYDIAARWILAGAVAVGFLVGHKGLDQLHAAGLAFAFLAGGMVLNVLKRELSDAGNSSLPAFLGGALVFGAIFLVARLEAFS